MKARALLIIAALALAGCGGDKTPEIVGGVTNGMGGAYLFDKDGGAWYVGSRTAYRVTFEQSAPVDAFDRARQERPATGK